MANLNSEQRTDFIGGYTKLLTAAWSADDFDVFVSSLSADASATLAAYGMPMPIEAAIEIRTQGDGGESLDQAVELWEQGINGGSYTIYVIHDDDIESVNLEEVSGAGTYCCSCCPCCTCT
jgi:hypothetical protein